MAVIHHLPVILSTLLLAAHFFRAGSFFPMLMSLALLPLLLLRKPWATRLVQVLLLVGGIEWIRTMVILIMQRQALGLPWGRMALILGGVALFTMASPWSMAVSSRQDRDFAVREFKTD